MSRRDEMMAKAAGIRSIADISVPEVKAADHVPRSGQGSYARRQAMEERIAMLEKFGGDFLSVAGIVPNPWQPRRIFKDEDIRKLADSIAEVGLIQPIVVRKKSVAISDTIYELVAGERRWRAHQLLGLEAIKSIVAEVTDEEMALMALAENLDREDLTDYETSKAIRRAESEFKSRTKMAEAIGLNRTDFYKYLAYNSLPDFILADLEVNPALIGRNTAVQLSTVLKTHGTKATDTIATLWPQVKSGTLDQTKLAPSIEASILRGNVVRTDRDIKKLFVGKEQAGSITRDASHLAIKIRTAALTPQKESELRAFVERMFAP